MNVPPRSYDSGRKRSRRSALKITTSVLPSCATTVGPKVAKPITEVVTSSPITPIEMKRFCLMMARLARDSNYDPALPITPIAPIPFAPLKRIGVSAMIGWMRLLDRVGLS